MGNCYKSGAQRQRLPQEDADLPVAVGQNRPLNHERVAWTSDVPLTEGQLRGKRDTFWDTAPAYDGRKEIWEALRAAAEAVDSCDYDLAQAILDGANISIPTGQLTEAYDELGNRYVIPPYCLNPPTDGQASPASVDAQPKQGKPAPSPATTGALLAVKVRLSTTGEDVNLSMPSTATIGDLKIKLCAEKNVQSQKVTMLYSGRVLADHIAIGELHIPKGYVIQAIVLL